MLLAATCAWGYTLYATAFLGKSMSLPIAGSGLVFFTSALILMCSGMLAELVYKTGDLREFRFSRLTQKVSSTFGIDEVNR